MSDFGYSINVPSKDFVYRQDVKDILQNALPSRGMWEIEGDVAKNIICETVADLMMDLEKLPSAEPGGWSTCFDCPLSHGCPVIKGCTNEQAMQYAGEIPDNCPLNKISEDPARKKGEWIANGDIPKECPFCGEDWDKYVFGDVVYTGDLPKFCPNCGEDMRKGEEE